MITKKNLLTRIESLEKELKEFKDSTKELSKQIDRLINCHESETKTSDYGWRYKAYFHKTESAKTERAGDVTLDDLAKLVIDGTPITITKSVEEEITPMCHDLQKSHKS